MLKMHKRKLRNIIVKKHKQGRHFYKMQGLQNHFVIIDARDEPFQPNSDLIKTICDVSIGVGAEQLVIIEPSNDAHYDAYIRLYNPDGSAAEACGNATRCVARLLMDEAQTSTVTLLIAGRTISCYKTEHGYQVSMGVVSFNWQDIPLSTSVDSFHPEFDSVAVNVGNPHIVLFVKNHQPLDKIAIGQQLQQHPALTESANIGFCQVLGPDKILLQVYERPGILTQACGSGACAAVAAGIKKGYLNDRVNVEMPGGNLEIEYKEPMVATMTGPAEYCFSGYLYN